MIKTRFLEIILDSKKYQKQLIKLEADIRKHIKAQFQMKLYIDHADASIATKDFELNKLKDEIQKLESHNKNLMSQLNDMTNKAGTLEEEIKEYKNSYNYRTTYNSNSKKHIKNHSVNLDDVGHCINLSKKRSDNKIRNSKFGNDTKKSGYSSCLTGFGAFKSGIMKRKKEENSSSNDKITALTKKPLSNSPQNSESKFYKKNKQISTSHNFNYSKDISNKNHGIQTINIRQLLSTMVSKSKTTGDNSQVKSKNNSYCIKSISKKKSDRPLLKNSINYEVRGTVKDIRDSKHQIKL